MKQELGLPRILTTTSHRCATAEVVASSGVDISDFFTRISGLWKIAGLGENVFGAANPIVFYLQIGEIG